MAIKRLTVQTECSINPLIVCDRCLEPFSEKLGEGVRAKQLDEIRALHQFAREVLPCNPHINAFRTAPVLEIFDVKRRER